VLAGRSGTSLTCLPAVAGRAPTVELGDCLPVARADDGDDEDGDAAAGEDDFASRADDDDAAIVVASPKSTANASLVVSGAEGFTRCSAGFERLRLRARFCGGEADLVAATFRFLDMGV
jgi:hypothetical protein